MGTAEQHGWRIAEVERLVSFSRRDIQRACYQGRGGAGVLTPSDSSWAAAPTTSGTWRRSSFSPKDAEKASRSRRPRMTYVRGCTTTASRSSLPLRPRSSLTGSRTSRTSSSAPRHSTRRSRTNRSGRSSSRTLTTARKSWAARRVALNARLRRQMTRPARNCFKN